MNKYFITGSTGFIGKELTRKLINQGEQLHLLVRDRKKANELNLSGVTIFEGDITDYRAVEEAMQGCSHVYHLAALAKPFSKDISAFDSINIDGTRNVLEAALKYGI